MNGCDKRDDRFSARTLSGAGKNLASQDGWISNWFRAREVSRGNKLFEARWRGSSFDHHIRCHISPPLSSHQSSSSSTFWNVPTFHHALDPWWSVNILRPLQYPSYLKINIIFHHPFFQLYALSLFHARFDSISKSSNSFFFTSNFSRISKWNIYNLYLHKYLQSLSKERMIAIIIIIIILILSSTDCSPIKMTKGFSRKDSKEFANKLESEILASCESQEYCFSHRKRTPRWEWKLFSGITIVIPNVIESDSRGYFYIYLERT